MKSILMLHWLGKLLHTTAYKESPLVRLITCSEQQIQGKTLHCVVHAAPLSSAIPAAENSRSAGVEVAVIH